MRKIIGLLLAAVILLSGCAATEPAGATVALAPEAGTSETTVISAAPEKEKLTSLGIAYLPSSGLNPLNCEATANRAVISLMYESLFVVNSKFQPEPVLCESFSVTADGMGYTFKLVPDVRFSDGSFLTANDVVSSITAARGSKYYRGRLSHVSYCSAQEDGSVFVQLDTGYENFALMLDVPIMKADTIENSVPTGTGPFSVMGYRLLRNANWWQTEAPAIDLQEITLIPCEDAMDLRDQFQFGDADVVLCDPNSPASTGYRCDLEIWEVPTTVMDYVGFNLGSGYFANDTLRRAVTYAIDRVTIAGDCYNGAVDPSSLPCSPKSDLFDVALSEKYDLEPGVLERAYEESGIKNSAEYLDHEGVFLVCSDKPANVKAAEIITEALVAAGLNIKLKAMDYYSYLVQLSSGNFDLYLGETRLTADFDLSHFFSEYGYLQYGSMVNENMVSLCYSAHMNSGNYIELCSRVMENGYLCPIGFKTYGVYITRGKLTDLEPALDYVFHLPNTGRTLSDVDKTYEVMEAEKQAQQEESYE